MTRAVQIAELGDQNVFTVDSDNSRIGIGTTNPQALLQVGTGVSVYGNSGIVSATTYYGSGAELTGITGGATLSAASGSQRVVVTSLTSGSMTAAGTNADLAYNTTTNTLSATTFSGALTGNASGTAGGLSGTPDITIQNVTGVAGTFTGFVAFSTSISVGGTITYEDVTNVDSVGLITARSGIEFGASGVGGTITATGQAEFAGVVTATSFVGSGANLTGLPAGGVEIESGGSSLGAGVTILNFQSGATVTASGAGSTITISAGITTTKYSPTANAIIQIGLGTAQHHELTLTAGFTTITTSGGSMGESHSLVLIQPSSGIATVGFSTFFQFPSGATPSMSEGSSKVDLVSFVVKDIAGNTGTGATELLASAGLNYQ